MLENRMVLDDYYMPKINYDEYEKYLEHLLEKDDEEWEEDL